MAISLLESENGNLSVTLYTSWEQLDSAEWDAMVPPQNFYLSGAYLSALNETLQDCLQFRYLVFRNSDQQPVAVAAVQVLDLNDQLKDKNDGSRFRNMLIRMLRLRLLICGNVFCCGESGFAHTDEITGDQGIAELSRALRKLSSHRKWGGGIVLLKEFWPDSLAVSESLEAYKFHGFNIDVNMVMAVSPAWKSFEDYLAEMVTKFRTKAKKVFKSSAPLEVVDMSTDSIATYRIHIDELYHAVVDSASFKLGELNADTFERLKRGLGQQFRLTGYFAKDELIGFSTAFMLDNAVDCNYVGLRYELNQQYDLYQRMLYDFVKVAITERKSEIRFGRTAEEIKSGIGALPVQMKLYAKHRNPLINIMLKPFISSIEPSEYNLRRPFKLNT